MDLGFLIKYLTSVTSGLTEGDRTLFCKSQIAADAI